MSFFERITSSAVCRNCIPPENLKKAKVGDWEVDREAGRARCSNCGQERNLRRYKKPTEPTTAQKEKARECRDYFEKRQNRGKRLAHFETEFFPEWGSLRLSLWTDDHPTFCSGISGMIGPRGGLEIDYIWDSGEQSHKRHMARHYARMLGARLKA